MKKYAIGIDVGGSHISCALVDLDEGRPVNGTRFEREVDNKADADTIIKNWALALKSSLASVGDAEFAGIGFGMPGPFDYHTGIARFKDVAKYESLNGVNVAEKLRVALNLSDDIPVRFMNDASAFAVGEAWIGSASESDKSVAITLGTGFGSAFVKNGVPVVEADDVPAMGCVWHLDFNGSIADNSFSTRWFIKRYEEVSGEKVHSVKQIADASANSVLAKRVFEEYGSNMGQFLGPWLKQFNADTLVIGGNVALAYKLFGPAFEAELQKLNVTTKIQLSTLQEDAAIIGSARMLDESYWANVESVIPLMA